MRYRGTKISDSGKRRAWRGAGALICAFAVAALLALATTFGSAGAASAPANPAPASSGLGSFGQSVLEVLGVPPAARALDAIGHGLALSEAQKRIVATERKLAREEAAEEASAEPKLPEEVKNPDEMVPASAGTNGSVDPAKVKVSDPIFAHTRPGDTGATAILLSGIALAPPEAPEAVQNVINAANQIIGRPYVWGGGHASFYSYGYDCSGSVSFALHGAGLIPEPLTSGSLEGWGEPGPRWHLMPDSTAGFVARHPPGL